MLSSDLLEAGSIWSSNVDSASMWIWIGPSDWRIGVDLQLIWLLELQIYTQFALRLRMNRALRSQCIRQSQSATLLTLPLTHCVISSVLAIEFRTRGHPAPTSTTSTVVAPHLHLLCVVFDSPTPATERFSLVRSPHYLTTLFSPQN